MTIRRLTIAGLGVLALACSSGPSGAAKGPSHATPNPIAQGQPTFRADPECGTYSGEGCAPQSKRIDLQPPTFSNPTEITNPLFPIAELQSVVLLGQVDGQPFRSETTLLPGTGTVVIGGEPVEVLQSQYTAYLNGRITEVALDRYAQADDGSVWYLGEDVYDYEGGLIAVSEGTWLAGRDGPPAMIMPADPKVGQVFRTEDIPGIVFEEVTVKEVGKRVDGPLGPVDGAIVAEELHLDGTTSEKVFAPGYGEFFTSNDSELEALAVAVTVDRAAQPEPVELAKMVTATWGLVESARLEEWDAVDASLELVKRNWAKVAASPAPARVADALDAALATLTDAVSQQDTALVTSAAVDVAQSALDLELRHRSVSYVDIDRFHLHAQQLRIDAALSDVAGVAAETATLEWIRDRIRASFTADELRQVDDHLASLRSTASSQGLAAAGDQAARLVNLVRRLSLP
jgi:hypothetical protein